MSAFRSLCPLLSCVFQLFFGSAPSPRLLKFSVNGLPRQEARGQKLDKTGIDFASRPAWQLSHTVRLCPSQCAEHCATLPAQIQKSSADDLPSRAPNVPILPNLPTLSRQGLQAGRTFPGELQGTPPGTAAQVQQASRDSRARLASRTQGCPLQPLPRLLRPLPWDLLSSKWSLQAKTLPQGQSTLKIFRPMVGHAVAVMES